MKRTTLQLFSFYFVVGLTSGLLSVAWPSIRATFGLPLDAVGLLMIVATIGSIGASFNSGRVIAALGMGAFLVVSSALASIGVLGYSLAPTWIMMVLVGLIYGIGNGSIHAAFNIYFAAHHNAGMMNWLHACFGLGATAGPLLITTLLQMGHSWRWGYGITGATLALFSAIFLMWKHRSNFQPVADVMDRSGSGSPPHRPSGETLKLPIVWLSVVLFFVYTGLEAAAGQWSYSLFTEARGVTESVAGFWTSVYWGAFTGGRVVLGTVADRLQADRMLRFSILGVIAGAVLLWWQANDWLSFLGLALMGLAEAPIFPMLTSTTSHRVGTGHADNAIGFQVTAASLGSTMLPALAGVLADALGLEVVGPFCLALALLVFILHEATRSPRL